MGANALIGQTNKRKKKARKRRVASLFMALALLTSPLVRAFGEDLCAGGTWLDDFDDATMRSD